MAGDAARSGRGPRRTSSSCRTRRSESRGARCRTCRAGPPRPRVRSRTAPPRRARACGRTTRGKAPRRCAARPAKGCTRSILRAFARGTAARGPRPRTSFRRPGRPPARPGERPAVRDEIGHVLLHRVEGRDPALHGEGQDEPRCPRTSGRCAAGPARCRTTSPGTGRRNVGGWSAMPNVETQVTSGDRGRRAR